MPAPTQGRDGELERIKVPELPEVETIRKQAEKGLAGLVIKNVQVLTSKVFFGDPTILAGEKFLRVNRVGKYLFVHFESGKGLVIHLKMTGRLVLNDSWYATAPHTRVVITLVDGSSIYYWDTRMFGYIKVEPEIMVEEQKIRAKLGPEVWEIDETQLLRKLQKTGRTIKDTILDQSVLAGVGNIYANDGLWKAGIDPRRKANTIKLSEIRKLLASLREVLERGLELGGASDNTFRDFAGKSGGYQKEFLVYGRTGEPCNNCGIPLRRIVVGGRGTWVCEKCQK